LDNQEPIVMSSSVVPVVRPPTLRRVASLVALLLLSSLPARAQAPGDADPPGAPQTTAGQPSPSVRPSTRPKIGLALAGGAARGIAHTGVLEWFEANRIPIDFIAGTSMGGLIGGAYSSGLSPQEIRELMRQTDWDNMFLADSPYKYKTFRRKEDSRLFPSQLKFGLEGGFKVPTGINPGQRILWLLDRIALPYGTMTSFDELPTPFRCVATDINAAEPVVLDSGSLALAMRATMAIPGIFTPVRMGNRLLVDGGALNNVPVDVVKAMGADIVIAVNVAADVDGEEQAELSLLGVIGKTIDTMMTPPVRAALRASDLVIDPDLKGLTSLDWRRSDDLADRGFAAARAMESQLLRFRLDEEAYRAHQQERAQRNKTRTPTISFVRITGVEGDGERIIRSAIGVAPGDTVDVDALELSLSHLTGNDRYDTIGYRVEVENGQPGLVLDVAPKSYAPPWLNIAFDLQNIDSTSFSANARVRAVFADVLNAGSELRADVTIGSNQFVGGELFVPFRRSVVTSTLGLPTMFAAGRAYFDRESVNGYQDGDLVAEYRFKRTGGGIDIGLTTGRRSEVRLGYDVRDVRGRLRVGDPVLPEATGSDKFASLRFKFDGLNSPLVPSRGTYVRATLQHFFDSADVTPEPVGGSGPDSFWRGEVRLNQFFRSGQTSRYFLTLAGGTAFGEEPRVNFFSLGGPFNLSSFAQDELRGPNYLLGGAGYLRRWFRLPDFLGADVLMGAWVETGSAFDELDGAQFEWSGSGGIIIEALLGPVFGGISTGTNGGVKFYISLAPLIR
jgi:NTE family protein